MAYFLCKNIKAKKPKTPAEDGNNNPKEEDGNQPKDEDDNQPKDGDSAQSGKRKDEEDKTTTLERNYNWASGSRLMEVLDKVSGRKTSFDYDVFGSLTGANYGDGTSELKNPDNMGCLYESTKRTDRIYDKGGKLLRDKKWFYHYDEEGNLLLKSTRPINIATVPLDEDEDLRHPLFRQIEQERLQEKHKNEPTISHFILEKADLTEWQSGDWAYEWFANGMLAKVKRPDGGEVTFEYDSLGRRTAKIYNGEITRFVWDGNVLLHKWKYDVKDRPQLIIDEEGNVEKNQVEPVENLITWIYENGNYVPSAKIIEGQKFSIISDYIGRPIQSFDEDGNLVWSTDYDIYGKLKNLKGNKNFIPFRQLGQYEDEELGGLYYNRYRYYDNEQGNYISKDPIGLEGNNPNLYGYLYNTNLEIDLLGLAGMPWHHLIPQEMFKNSDFMKELNKITGDGKNYIHRQGAFIEEGLHKVIHKGAGGGAWNDAFNEWFSDLKDSGGVLSKKNIQGQLKKMMKDFNIPNSSRNFARKYKRKTKTRFKCK